MEEQAKELSEYLAAFKKRKMILLVISSIIFTLSAILAYLLPATYKSSSTILIEQQGIPSNLVQSTVTSYASERIQTIQARVMSRTNLMEIIEKFDLYADERKYETTESIVERMRSATKMNLISADVIDPRTGKPSMATIAFSLSFVGESPANVQRVASELTSLYLNENVKSRTQKAEETSLFLSEEVSRLGAQITELENKLAEFKQNNANTLPSVKMVNMQALQRAESELTAIDTKLQSLETNELYLRGQLTYVDPKLQSTRLIDDYKEKLESDYASLSARYSADHPDLIRIKAELDAMNNVSGSNDGLKTLETQLESARIDLAGLKKRYTSDHPDVITAESNIKALEKKIVELKTNANGPEQKDFDGAENPAYVNIISQLKSIEGEREAIYKRKKELNNKIEKIEGILAQMPQVEAQYLVLTRDYENARHQYQETKAKQMKADVAKQLEEESKGERFTLIDPPAFPEEPISPNRPAILFIGFILSISGSVGFTLVAEMLGGAIHGAKSIYRILGAEPLSVLPYRSNGADLIKRKRNRLILVSSIISSIVITLVIIHFYVSPLDVLWFRLMRKGDMITG